LSMFSEFGFQTDAWYAAVKAKIDNLIAIMNEPERQGTYIVLSDADIQYFNTSKILELVEQARENNLDFYGMQEVGVREFNTGFFIVRNSKDTRDLLTLNSLPHPSFGDQTIINRRLGLVTQDPKFQEEIFTDRIKFDFIPTSYIVQAQNVPNYPQPNLLCHHATHTTGTQDKLNQIQWVRNWYLNQSQI